MSSADRGEGEVSAEPMLMTSEAEMTDARALMREQSVRDIELAVTAITAWAIRNDVHQETMRLAECDLPKGHAWLLCRLSTCDPIRLGELASALGIDSSTLTPQAQRLERDGLVIREPDPSDGRATLLRLTLAGHALLARVQASRRALLTARLHSWTDAERARAATILSRLAAAL
jgi:DNA-binding MarR family transcriptional regulator